MGGGGGGQVGNGWMEVSAMSPINPLLHTAYIGHRKEHM